MNAEIKPIRETLYQRLRKVNVSDRTEKKNGMTYLSWAYAVDQLLQEDSGATWEYQPTVMYGETMMVFCSVNAFGKTMTAQLPVMDHRNKPIPNPDAFAVNTAMQRCLVKAIALHGLGLYIYAGEDLPGDDLQHSPAKLVAEGAAPGMAADLAKRMRDALAADVEEHIKALSVYDIHAKVATQAELYSAASNLLESKERSAWKAYVAEAKKIGNEPMAMRR